MAGPRVRIHLRLPEPRKAEICIRLNQYGHASQLISSPHIANADTVILEDVVPIINETKRQQVAAGTTGKIPHAYLEGNLVSWSGYFNKRASKDQKQLLFRYHQEISNNQSVISHIFETGYQIGYNPKKYRVFYGHPAETAGQSLKQKFCAASQLVAVNWAFIADRGAVFTALNAADREDGAAKAPFSHRIN